MVKKRNSTFGCFIAALMGVWIVAFMVSRLVMEAANTAVFVAMVLTVLLITTGGFASMFFDRTNLDKRAALPRDPSMVQRVVIDTYTNEEFIVAGTPDTTFGDACRKDWQFQSISSDSWIIKDERGNDITSNPLASYHGIARIESIAPMETRRPYDEVERESRETEEYADMERGVEFYD